MRLTSRSASSPLGLVVLCMFSIHCSRTAGEVSEGRSSSTSGKAGSAGTAGTTGGAAGNGGTTTGGIGATGGGTNGAGTSGAGATTGTNPCGVNAKLCDGVCKITLTDPDNCGACGVVCAADQVCSGGSCSDPFDCSSGFIDCNQTCVDPFTNNANCGSCGNACSSGQGCSSGFCVATVPLTGPGPNCANGGPPTEVTTPDAGTVCGGALAQITFRWAVCSCNSVTDTGLLLTDSFNSLFGPYVDGGLGGGVGANNNLNLAGAFGVGGSLWADSTAGLNVAGGAKIGIELHDNGPFDGLGVEGVGANAYVNGNVTSLGLLTIQGDLYVPQSSVVTPFLVSDQQQILGPVAVGPPCDCSSSQLIDVAGIVAYGAVNNDNATIGLDPNVFATGALLSATRLDLPCGSYYLSSIQANGTMTIAIHGNTALFIGGDVNPNGLLQITLDRNSDARSLHWREPGRQRRHDVRVDPGAEPVAHLCRRQPDGPERQHHARGQLLRAVRPGPAARQPRDLRNLSSPATTRPREPPRSTSTMPSSAQGANAPTPGWSPASPARAVGTAEIRPASGGPAAPAPAAATAALP